MPDALLHGLHRAAGREVPETIDLAPLERLGREPLDALADPGRLATDILPAMGLSDQLPSLFPEELQPAVGRGTRHWQYPIQFGRYLVELSRHRIESYLEIGVQHGGTFAITVEYLSRFSPLRRALGVDLAPVPSLRAYRRANPAVESEAIDSQASEFRELVAEREPFDLVLIDGDHAEEAVRHDFETVRDSARLIAFHDIVDSLSPGVAAVWAEVRERYTGVFDFHEFTDQYPEVSAREGGPFLGIGLAVRRARQTGGA
jgi:hypothetical protein